MTKLKALTQYILFAKLITSVTCNVQSTTDHKTGIKKKFYHNKVVEFTFLNKDGQIYHKSKNNIL
jgi:hypothetical protein